LFSYKDQCPKFWFGFLVFPSLDLRVFSYESWYVVFVLFLCSLGVCGYLALFVEKGD